MINDILKNFETPPVNMYGAPFWAWNGKLEEKTLRQQIRTMKEMGMGGFFMHSRTGLATPYLEKEWFDAVSACIDEAEKQNMLAYLYDEDRWPSGAAGGIVTSDDRFKARKLFCTAEAVPLDGKSFASFALTLKDNIMISMRRLNEGESPAENEQKFNFYIKLMECSTWFNNAAYLDTMNPEAVKRFIEVTHDAYAERYQNKFSSSVPAMFTDEPCYIHGEVSSCLPWTDKIPEEFKKRFGYDLTDRIPELFFNTEYEVSEVRHDFYDLLGALFADNFFGLIAGWGDKHDLPLCGHLVGEDALSSQTLYIGSAMRCYEKMQIPGVDVLTEHWNIFNTVKQLSSAARQLGKKYRMSETYGCTGWDFPFFGHKAIGEWQYALGVNMRCLHLTWYSMAGEGKRDYPACFSDHSPWFKQYSFLENHFARLGAVLSEGEEIRDLLVIHPIESLWSVLVKDIPLDNASSDKRKIQPGRKVLDFFDSDVCNKLDQAHTDLTNLLLAENLDFDFGDEEMMSRLASTDGTIFRIGKAEYKQILIPELKTVRSSTLELLSRFKGRIYYLGEIPAFVDGRPSDKAAEYYKNFISAAWDELTDKISSEHRRVSVTDANNTEAETVFFRLADCGDSFTFFIVNTSMGFTSDQKNGIMVRDRLIPCPDLTVKLALPFRGNIAELDPSSGTKKAIPYDYIDGKYVFKTALDIIGSRLFVISDIFGKCDSVPAEPQLSAPEPLQKETSYACSCSEPNILVLDHASWETQNASSEKAEYILLLDDKLRAMMGEPPRGGKMEQPWHRKDNGIHKSMPIKLFYTFECTDIPDCEYYLTIENPEKFMIYINDVKLKQQKDGFYLDPAMVNLKFDSTLLKKGKNTLKLVCDSFDRFTELEAIFIRGDFGVDTNGRLTNPVSQLHIGDWCSQGLLNYAGNVTYFTEIDLKRAADIEFPQWRGSLIGLKIDDAEEIILAWAPFRNTIPPGKHRLSITVYGHRRNAMGPFYLNEKWPERTGPYQFKVYESTERQLVPCGLLQTPQLFFHTEKNLKKGLL